MNEDKNIIKQKTNYEILLDKENSLDLCKTYFGKYKHLSLDLQRSLIMDMERIVALGFTIEEQRIELVKENRKSKGNYWEGEQMTKEYMIEKTYDEVIEMTKVYNNDPEKLIEFMLDINEALRDESYRNISLDNENETLRNEIRNKKQDQFRDWESAERWGRLTGDYGYFDQCNDTYCDL